MKSLSAVLSLLLILVLACLAQQPNGSLGGLVTDPQDAAVPHARNEVAVPATGLKFSAETNERGQWTLPALLVGTYEATVTAAGFKTAVIKGIKIDPATPATLNVILQLGAVTETVEVAGGEIGRA